MPELPEVEQVRSSLVPHVVGRKFTDVRVDVPKMVLHPGVEEFQKKLIGRTITGVGRRGKYLRLELDNGTWLLVHLRMTGVPAGDIGRLPVGKAYPPCFPSATRQGAAFL